MSLPNRAVVDGSERKEETLEMEEQLPDTARLCALQLGRMQMSVMLMRPLRGHQWLKGAIQSLSQDLVVNWPPFISAAQMGHHRAIREMCAE